MDTTSQRIILVTIMLEVVDLAEVLVTVATTVEGLTVINSNSKDHLSNLITNHVPSAAQTEVEAVEVVEIAPDVVLPAADIIIMLVVIIILVVSRVEEPHLTETMATSVRRP